MAIKDRSLLEAALVGYEQERNRILGAIAEIRSQFGGRRVAPRPTNVDGEVKPTRRRMSAAARQRIAAAQKKRWAAYKKQKAAAA